MEKEHFEILLEDIKEKFELVLEGHATLRHDIKDLRQDMNEKFELVDFKIDTLSGRIERVEQKIDTVEEKLSRKIDNVAADLAAHRADTESHPKGYKVSE